MSSNNKILNLILHTGDEFFTVSKLFIIGVLITSSIQVFIPKSIITGFAGEKYTSIFIMMLITYTMSICSTSDSFIGRSFASTVPLSGILGFIVFGPVLDLKNTIMMLGYFKRKFVLEFVLFSFLITFCVVSIISTIVF